MNARSFGITEIRLFRNGKLRHIPPKSQLLDILRHNIPRRSIQRLCDKVWELSGMRRIQADQLTFLLSVHNRIEHRLQLAGILASTLLIERLQPHDEGIRSIGANQILIAAIQKTDHMRGRFVRDGKDLHEVERLLHLLRRYSDALPFLDRLHVLRDIAAIIPLFCI